ncbi:hypothetical protein ACFL08_00030 [Patescibacteria group bacterium]
MFVAKVTLERKEVIEMVKERTREWSMKYKYVQEKSEDPTIAQIVNIIHDSDNIFEEKIDYDQKLFLARFSELIVEAKYGVKHDIAKFSITGGVSFDNFIMIVPLAHRGNHNYPLNEPCFIHAGGPEAIRLDSRRGNSLPDDERNALRPATDEEIEYFFSKDRFDAISREFRETSIGV